MRNFSTSMAALTVAVGLMGLMGLAGVAVAAAISAISVTISAPAMYLRNALRMTSVMVSYRPASAAFSRRCVITSGKRRLGAVECE